MLKLLQGAQATQGQLAGQRKERRQSQSERSERSERWKGKNGERKERQRGESRQREGKICTERKEGQHVLNCFDVSAALVHGLSGSIHRYVLTLIRRKPMLGPGVSFVT